MPCPKGSTNNCVDCGAPILCTSVRCFSCSRKAIHAQRRQDIIPPNPSGICMCGCGQSAPIATYSSRKTGWLKGHPKQFIFGHGSPGREKIDRTKSPIEGSDYRVEDRGYKTPCWAWLRHLTKRGYPHVSTPNGPLCAHRWTYEMFVGPIPNGLEIDHLCRQPDCVNPDHLEPVTSPENMRRARAARAAGG